MADQVNAISTGAFSTDSSEAFTDHSAPSCSQLKRTLPEQLEWLYELKDCSEWIKTNGFRKVCLQFPDSLLPDSGSLASYLERETSAQCYILADTSYGSCCVDEVAAGHVNGDALIHFGDACLSTPTGSVPVRYVLPKSVGFEITADQIDKLMTKLTDDQTHRIKRTSEGEPFGSTATEKSSVVVLYDLAFKHAEDAIIFSFQSCFTAKLLGQFNFFIAKAIVPGQSSPSSDQDKSTENTATVVLGRKVVPLTSSSDQDIGNSFVTVYIGKATSPLLTLWALTHPQSPQIYCMDPTTPSPSSAGCWELISHLNVNRTLRKRLFLVEKIKDAEIIGIVCGTLGVGDHVESVRRLKQLVAGAGKRSYTFSVGKLNGPKLANFATDIDVFCLVSCPFGVMLDCSEYFRPIVSPFEMELALNKGRPVWAADTGLQTEFQKLMKDDVKLVCDRSEAEGSENGEGDLDNFSLITGQMRVTTQSAVAADDKNSLLPYNPGNSSAFVRETPIRRGMTGLSGCTSSGGRGMRGHQAYSSADMDSSRIRQHSSGIRDYFRGRSWKGLEENQEDGSNEPSEIKEGRSGIPVQYRTEERTD